MSVELGALAESLIKAGAPILGQVLGGALPFPFNLVASAALNSVGSALGVPPTPTAIATAINADPTAAADKLSEIEAKVQADMETLKAQSAVNEEEAKSTNLYISAWRPTFAWCIMFWMNYNFLAYIVQWHYTPPLPSELFNPAWVLFGGMMGLRTVEKWAGVARSTLSGAEVVLRRVIGKK